MIIITVNGSDYINFGQVLGLLVGSSIGCKRETSVYRAWVSFLP